MDWNFLKTTPTCQTSPFKVTENLGRSHIPVTQSLVMQANREMLR